MALVNGFRTDDIVNLMTGCHLNMNVNELFGLIRADEPPVSPTHIKTVTDLYRAIDVSSV